MSYIVNQDIIDRVGNDTAAQLTTDSGTTPDQTVLDKIRLNSEGEANSYLSKRYAVPVDLTAHADLAEALKGFVLDIAVYRLSLRRLPVPKDYEQARNNAIKWFERVAKGEVHLPAAVTPASTTSDDPPPSWGSKTKGGVEGEE